MSTIQRLNTCNWIVLPIILSILTCSRTEVERLSDDQLNILLVIADDLGKNVLSAYNADAPRTKYLDHWAKGGIQMHNFYVTSPVCSPSRASILTGWTATKTRVHRVLRPSNAGLDHELSSATPTLAEYLKNLGYRTSLIGKWHLGYRPENHPLERGFDEFRGFLPGHIDYISHLSPEGKFGLQWNKDKWDLPKGAHLTEILTSEAINQIDEWANDKPNFMVLSYANAHTPYLLQNDSAVFPGKANRSDNNIEDYQALVALLDQQVGRIQKALEQKGGNTIIIFLSDNGPPSLSLYTSDRARAKGSLFEPGVNVPAFIYWPGRVNATQDYQLRSALDLFPTVLSIASKSAEKDIDIGERTGQNILETLHGSMREVLVQTHRGIGMVRVDSLKAIFIPNDTSKITLRHLEARGLYLQRFPVKEIDGYIPLVFDLHNDPNELVNLASADTLLTQRLWSVFQSGTK